MATKTKRAFSAAAVAIVALTSVQLQKFWQYIECPYHEY
jgi:hypothetical protein